MMLKNYQKFATLAVLLGTLGLAAVLQSLNASSIVEMHHSYAANFADDKILMGASHNVFVAKVVKEIGQKERGVGPETQFEVEVIENIKGDLKGDVILNQLGGYKDGKLYIAERDSSSNNAEDYLLKEGAVYLFATRYNEKEDWYTLNSHPAAIRLISLDSSLGIEELKVVVQDEGRVNALREAYREETPLEVDVKAGIARNSYKSLSEENAEKKTTADQNSNIQENIQEVSGENEAPTENTNVTGENAPEEAKTEAAAVEEGQ
jgi:hypothetical protein